MSETEQPDPTPEELAAWAELAAKATLGQNAQGRPYEAMIQTENGGYMILGRFMYPADAAFFAAAREGWPRTLRALERANARIAELEDTLFARRFSPQATGTFDTLPVGARFRIGSGGDLCEKTGDGQALNLNHEKPFGVGERTAIMREADR